MGQELKSRCVICETPYNIFNAVKYFLGTGLNESTDIYIGNNLEYLKERLLKAEVFKEVIVFKNNVDLYSNKIGKVLHRFFVKKSVKDSLPDDYVLKRYTVVYLFSATRFPSDFIYLNSKAEVIFIEDGMDSYIGRIWLGAPTGIKNKALNLITGKQPTRLKPHKVLLNAPELCDSKQDYEVFPIGGDKKKTELVNDTLKKIYNYQPTQFYNDKRIFYLGQAFIADGMGDGIGSIEDEIANLFSQKSEKIVYRKHPRETEFSKNWKFIDKGEAMWELVCQEHLTNDSILISSFSTAMFTPKLLYDKEPWLIYTYKLYKDFFKEDNPMTRGLNKGNAAMTEQLKKTYSRPEKIICIESIEEIEHVLKKIETENENV